MVSSSGNTVFPPPRLRELSDIPLRPAVLEVFIQPVIVEFGWISTRAVGGSGSYLFNTIPPPPPPTPTKSAVTPLKRPRPKK